MEDQQHLFELQLDPASQASLSETARWGKFLSIMGFILIGLLVLEAIFIGTIMSALTNSLPGYQSAALPGAFMTIIILLAAAIWFVPNLYLYKFSTQIKRALQSSDQDQLTQAFESQKKLFKFIGIVTIIYLGIIALVIVGAIIVGIFSAMGRR
jgi:MFS family permease